MLGRSKSFRMLRGGLKEAHQRDEDITPQFTLSPTGIDRLKAATPVTRRENRVETSESEMQQRPRTSSGPGDRSTPFHKKVIPVQYLGDPRFNASYTSLTRSTTTLTKSTTTLTKSTTTLTKSTTTLNSAQLPEGEGIIGIALGSPTMPPQHYNVPHSTDFVTQKQGTVTEITSNNQSSEASRPVKGTQTEAPKPKLSRWKSIFKKTAPPPKPNKDTFYQLAKAANSARVVNQQAIESVDFQSFIFGDDASTKPSPTATFKSDIRPSRSKKGQVEPADTRPRALTVGSTLAGKAKPPMSKFSLSPRPQRQAQDSPQPPSVKVSGTSQNASPRKTDEKPLLDVDIPQVQLERYSVMFSGLLEPQNNNSSSSLLYRRQGNADKVTPLSGLPTKNEGTHGRATSPNLRSKSPSGQLSLFPSANTSRAPSPHIITNRPRALQRTKTAPAAPPSQPTFPSNPVKPDVVVQETDYPDTPSLSQASSPASTSDHSFDSNIEDITIVATPVVAAKPWRPQVQDEEPVWEIIQRQPSTVTKASALRSHPTSATSPSFKEPAFKTVTVAHSPALNRAKSHAALKTSSQRLGLPRLETDSHATVGVARSVSVSRATRSPDSLLTPGSAKSPDEKGLNPGRFVDAGALTPMLVELKNRRSHRVTLVDA